MSGFEITIKRYASSREKCNNDEQSMLQQCRKRKSENDSWLKIVPSERVIVKQCDEITDEFKRAGIGLCFEGKVNRICHMFH